MNNLEHFLPVQNKLGEGPVWDPRSQVLYWVDIKQNHLYQFDSTAATHQRFELTTFITALGIRASGGLITTGGEGFAIWDEESNTLEPIVDPESNKPHTRSNDGAVDPGGRFWAGTMDKSNGGESVNGLYRLDADLSVHKMLDDVALSNGLGWSPDHKTMCFSDSLRYAVFTFDYDISTGDISNRRRLIEIPQEEGVPDRLTVDSKGSIWLAIWGVSNVVRFDANGRRFNKIAIPAQQVTSCMFGGAELDELYITTAWDGLDDETRQRQPHTGDLFRLKTVVKGMEDNIFAG